MSLERWGKPKWGNRPLPERVHHALCAASEINKMHQHEYLLWWVLQNPLVQRLMNETPPGEGEDPSVYEELNKSVQIK